ncbi:unnamed protein product [Phytophthora fragariaefolia]|uniref:Unnamed protein product n=1 Tax=Phytophthora fragariaefolia TaxID=1490495 RepID=A0A9W7D1S4_9STRA|nr:unnamed protein product [Phytophthora fragariaefolia]
MAATTRKMAAYLEAVKQPPRGTYALPSTKNSNKKHSHSATWAESVQLMEVGDVNNPGIVIDWSDDAMLHACLGVAGSPIPLGANPAASGAALRAWVSGLVVAVNTNSPVIMRGTPSSQPITYAIWSNHAGTSSASDLGVVRVFEGCRS